MPCFPQKATHFKSDFTTFVFRDTCSLRAVLSIVATLQGRRYRGGRGGLGPLTFKGRGAEPPHFHKNRAPPPVLPVCGILVLTVSDMAYIHSIIASHCRAVELNTLRPPRPYNIIAVLVFGRIFAKNLALLGKNLRVWRADITGVQISRSIANFGDRDIHLAIDATDSGNCPTDSKYSTCA